MQLNVPGNVCRERIPRACLHMRNAHELMEVQSACSGSLRARQACQHAGECGVEEKAQSPGMGQRQA